MKKDCQILWFKKDFEISLTKKELEIIYEINQTVASYNLSAAYTLYR